MVEQETHVAEKKRIWEMFPELAEVVRKAHEEVGLYGHHDWLHAFRVGDMAYRIGIDQYGDRTIARTAGAAGLCHNADRILQKKLELGRRDVPEEKLRELVFEWLNKGKEDFFKRPIVSEDMLEAVLKHDSKEGGDLPVAICLVDADKVVNCRPELLLRSAQFYHDLPVLDPIHWDKDPTANYRNPKTVIKDVMMSSLEWAGDGPFGVRTQLAKKLINDPEIGAPFFSLYLELLKKSLEKEGLYPWPSDFSSPMPPEKPSVA